jgi:hypothetical protein
MVKSQYKGRTRRCPSTNLKAGIKKESNPLSSTLFCSILELSGLNDSLPPREGICFTDSTHSNINFMQKYPHRHTQKSSLIWVPLGAVKLAHKINYHVYQIGVSYKFQCMAIYKEVTPYTHSVLIILKNFTQSAKFLALFPVTKILSFNIWNCQVTSNYG